MLVRIKSSNLVWTAPDGKIKIWDFQGVLPTGEQMQGQTRSGKIAQSIDQTLDLTTTVSQSNKTYYVQVPREDQHSQGAQGSGGFTQAAQPLPTLGAASHTAEAAERFTRAVEKFEKAVDRFAGRVGNNGDVVASEQEVNKITEFFGSDAEVVDDIT